LWSRCWKPGAVLFAERADRAGDTALGDRCAGSGRPARWTRLALHVSALALQASANLWLARRSLRPILGWAWRIQAVWRWCSGVVLLAACNPAFVDRARDGITLVARFALLLAAGRCLLAALAMRRAVN